MGKTLRKRFFLFLAILGTAFILLSLWPVSGKNSHNEQTPEQRHEDELDRYINLLASKYECSAECPANFRHLDSNGEYSYSCLQFQWLTFLDRVRFYHLADQAENAEIMNLIYDCSLQKAVAREMFLHEPNAWQHWRTSVARGLGMPPA